MKTNTSVIAAMREGKKSGKGECPVKSHNRFFWHDGNISTAVMVVTWAYITYLC